MVSVLPLNSLAYRDRKKQATTLKVSTLKSQVHLIPHSTTIESQAHPVSPSNMSSASKTNSSNRPRQAMATKPKMQKFL